VKAATSDIAYGSFKKDHGPPYGYWPQTFDELDHNQYLQSRKVDVEALRNHHQPAAPAKVEEWEKGLDLIKNWKTYLN